MLESKNSFQKAVKFIQIWFLEIKYEKLFEKEEKSEYSNSLEMDEDYLEINFRSKTWKNVWGGRRKKNSFSLLKF